VALGITENKLIKRTLILLDFGEEPRRFKRHRNTVSTESYLTFSAV